VTELPEQILAGNDATVVGTVETVLITTVLFAQTVVLHIPSALTK
jgi:hypothetical protein